jgi:hypothetical protein
MAFVKTLFCVPLFGLILTINPASLFAASFITIENITDIPDSFSPDGDGIDDTVAISAVIGAFGFNSSKPLSAACAITITDSKGTAVDNLEKKITLSDNTRRPISFLWDGKNKRGKVVSNGIYQYAVSAKINKQLTTVPGGAISLFIPPVLSVSVSPCFWNVGQAGVNAVATMSKGQAITVTNDGKSVATYSLNLINPTGWQASQTGVGKDSYILNAAFSRNPRRIIWKEANHALSVVPMLCSYSRFAGDQTGVSVQPGLRRTLWLQFKSPSSTGIADAQEIKVIITASPE